MTRSIPILLALFSFCLILNGTSEATQLYVIPPAAAEAEEELPMTDPSQPVESIINEPTDVELIAESFKTNCIAKKHPIMEIESQEKFCGCTSEKIAATMTGEELQSLTQNTPAGKKVRSKMMVSVYAPCMEFPTYDLIYKNCAQKTKLPANIIDPKKLCACAAKKMSVYMGKNAETVMMEALKDNPETTNPLGPFFKTASFRAESKTQLLSCIQAASKPKSEDEDVTAN